MTQAVALDPVKPETAVDLSGEAWLRHVKRRRKLAEHTDAVESEIQRLIRRANWRTRKAARLPIGNGKRKAVGEAIACQMLARILGAALAGKPTPKMPFTGHRHLDRATELLHTLQAA